MYFLFKRRAILVFGMLGISYLLFYVPDDTLGGDNSKSCYHTLIDDNPPRHQGFIDRKDVQQLWERKDLQGAIDADRPLALEDLNLVMKLADYLIDKRVASGRSSAANLLGRFGHVYAMPALLAAFRDESNSDDLRTKCLKALSMIRDERVVCVLIDEGLGDNSKFDGQAISGLVQLAGKPPELYDTSYAGSVKWPPDHSEKRDEYLNVWREWWKENRDTIKLDRGGGLIAR